MRLVGVRRPSGLFSCLLGSALACAAGCGSGVPDGTVVQSEPDSAQKRMDKVKSVQKQMLEQGKNQARRR